MNRMTEDRMFTRRRFLVGYAGAVATSIAGTGLIERKVYSASRRDEKSLPVIDTHMHVWSGDPKRFPLVHPYNPNSEAPKVAGTVEMLLEEMKQYGVTHCVLVQVIYHGWDNSYVAHCVKLHPERFRGHGLIDPTDPEVASKLEYWMIEHGLSGMRFSPIYYKGKDDWMTSDAHHALWKKASSLSAVFNFFIGTEQLPKLETMVARYPDVRIVIDHFARVDLKASDPLPEFQKLLRLAKYPNVWCKVTEMSVISATGTFPYEDTFPWVRRLYDGFGPDRLIWGTGFPGETRKLNGRPTLQQELDLIQREIDFLTPEDRKKILGQTAAKLWGFETVAK